jgi:hypothetical protein
MFSLNVKLDSSSLYRFGCRISPVGLMVHGHHISFLDHSVLARQISLGKGDFVTAFANLFAHELVVPVVGVVGGGGLEAGDYERHC